MEINQDIIDLVVARLENLPSGKDISIGSHGEFSKEQLIEHVKKTDDVGRKMIEIEMDFLRLMKEGIYYDQHSPSSSA
jgi:hypothetical protein